ncbi:MAG: CHAD domain-containing protein [Burkholderiales bacterium]|nr:CHAD domain-containing protein [Burkholderiales bacterium]
MAIPSQASATSKKTQQALRSHLPAAPVSVAGVASTAKKVKLKKNVDIEHAFQAIVFNCVDQILANQDCLRSNYNAESLHQLRVALRRLRATFSLFKNRLPIPDGIQNDLKWFARQLNPVRDCDVFATTILPYIAASMDMQDSLQELMHHAQSVANQRHQAVISLLASERFTLFMLNLCLWMHGLGWRDTLSEKQRHRVQSPAKKFANKRLLRLKKLLRSKGKKIDFSDTEALHKIRICIKNIRYTGQFFHSLISSKQEKAYLNELSALQTRLGKNNDIVVADRLLFELRHEQFPLAKSIDSARNRLTQLGAVSKKKLRQRWKKSDMFGSH